MPRSVAYLDAAPAGAGACEPEPCVRQGSDGCDSVFEDGRVRSTLPGDMFLIGEVYGFNGRPDEGLKSSIAQITVAIRSYKISREWRWRDSCSGKWKDLFRRGVADRAIFDKLNEFSVAAEFDRPVLINGETHPGIQWEESDKFPGSRAAGFALMRERLVVTAPGKELHIREAKGMFVVADRCPQLVRTIPVLPRDQEKPRHRLNRALRITSSTAAPMPSDTTPARVSALAACRSSTVKHMAAPTSLKASDR